MKRVFSILILLLSTVVLLAACGGGGGNSTATPTYSVGGTVSGLSGSGLVLQDNGGDDLTISASANGTFTFLTSVADGAGYNVTVKTQPTGPLQTCTASNNAGTIAGTNITSVQVVCSTTCGSSQVVISQVYGGGGNSGSPYQNDFIELFNKGVSAVDVSAWSVQYAGAAGSSWTVTNLSGSIPAGGHMLIQEAAGTGSAPSLPTPDIIGTVPMSSTAGKVALVKNQTALVTSCPTISAIVDFVGYGAANCYEGSGPTPAPSNTMSVIRNEGGCKDTDNNNADFTSLVPMPRNSADISISCGCNGP